MDEIVSPRIVELLGLQFQVKLCQVWDCMCRLPPTTIIVSILSFNSGLSVINLIECSRLSATRTSRGSVFRGKLWQVRVKLWQVRVKLWQVRVKLWEGRIKMWQVRVTLTNSVSFDMTILSLLGRGLFFSGIPNHVRLQHSQHVWSRGKGSSETNV
jgi:hypothetical protein